MTPDNRHARPRSPRPKVAVVTVATDVADYEAVRRAAAAAESDGSDLQLWLSTHRTAVLAGLAGAGLAGLAALTKRTIEDS